MWEGIAAFLSGAASVLGATYGIKRIIRRCDEQCEKRLAACNEDCDKRLAAFREGLDRK